jgi:hypothetical protein
MVPFVSHAKKDNKEEEERSRDSVEDPDLFGRIR